MSSIDKDMAVEDDMCHDLISSSIYSNELEDQLSPEDVAWVDSCLVEGPELLNGGWDGLRDALLDILSPKSSSQNNSSIAENKSFKNGADSNLLVNEETRLAQSSRGTNNDQVPTNDESELTCFPGENENNFPITEKTDTAQFHMFLQNGYLLDKHDQRGNGDSEAGTDFESTYELESLNEDFFRIWDLDIPVEEDELVQELNKVLAESSLEDKPSMSDNSSVGEYSNKEMLDLVAGISGLSLHQSSG